MTNKKGSISKRRGSVGKVLLTTTLASTAATGTMAQSTNTGATNLIGLFEKTKTFMTQNVMEHPMLVSSIVAVVGTIAFRNSIYKARKYLVDAVRDSNVNNFYIENNLEKNLKIINEQGHEKLETTINNTKNNKNTENDENNNENKECSKSENDCTALVPYGFFKYKNSEDKNIVKKAVTYTVGKLVSGARWGIGKLASGARWGIGKLASGASSVASKLNPLNYFWNSESTKQK